MTDVTNSDINVSPWLANIGYPLFSYLVLPLYFGKIKITGQENIPRQNPLIVAPIHRSRWDAIIVPHVIGKPISKRDPYFMVSANEMKGLQGWFIKRLGGFPVDTDNPRAISVRSAVELLLEGKMVVIFPEGGIFQDDQVHPLKRGVAGIALDVLTEQPECGMQILPVSIKYSQCPPIWGTDIEVKIGKPINVTDYINLSHRQGSKKLTADLESSLKVIHSDSNQIAVN